MSLVIVVVTSSDQVERLAAVGVTFVVVVVLNLEVWHPDSAVFGIFLAINSESSIVVGWAVYSSNVVVSVVQPESTTIWTIDTNNLQTVNTLNVDVLFTLDVDSNFVNVVSDPLHPFHGDVVEHLACVLRLPGEV